MKLDLFKVALTATFVMAAFTPGFAAAANPRGLAAEVEAARAKYESCILTACAVKEGVRLVLLQEELIAARQETIAPLLPNLDPDFRQRYESSLVAEKKAVADAQNPGAVVPWFNSVPWYDAINQASKLELRIAFVKSALRFQEFVGQMQRSIGEATSNP